jgi:hypothetical protein
MRVNREVRGVRMTAMRARAYVALATGVIGLLSATACTRSLPPKPSETVVDLNGSGQVDGPTKVRVENQNVADMTIYVYQGSQRMRIGRVSGNGTTDIVIPKSVVSGVTTLRFGAEPLGNRRGIVSQPIPVSPGDLVEFFIPSN